MGELANRFSDNQFSSYFVTLRLIAVTVKISLPLLLVPKLELGNQRKTHPSLACAASWMGWISPMSRMRNRETSRFLSSIVRIRSRVG